MSNYNSELLNQAFINWPDVTKDPNFSKQPNSAKNEAWKNWSEYADDYWTNQFSNASDADKPQFQKVIDQLHDFVKKESKTVAEDFTLAGKLSKESDTNTILEYLKSPDSAAKDGYTSEEYAAARKRTEDYLLPQLRSFYESTGDSAPDDAVLRKKLWEEPNFADHFRNLQSNLAKGFATVFLGTVQGIGGLIDLMPEMPDSEFRHKPGEDTGGENMLTTWARDKSKMFQENLPSDPRMNKWSEAAYSGFGQAPAQALTAWNTPLNFTANFTQTYSQETDNIFEEQKKKLFNDQKAAGMIPEQTPQAAWEKTLSKEQIDDLRASAGLKAIPSTVVNAALETVAEKFAMKGIPWSSIPGGKVIQDKINKLMKTKPVTAVGARIFSELGAVALEEGATEGVQQMVSNTAQAVAGRGELPSGSEFINQVGENVVGGAAGGIGMSGMHAPISAYRQQAIFDQSNKILDGTAPSIQGLKAQYEAAVNEYGESSPQAEAVQKAITDVEDSAHYALYQLNSPDADKKRAERYKAANEAKNTFRDQLLRWVGENQNGVEKLDEIEADRNNKVAQVRKKWAGIRQSFKDNGLNIEESALQRGEASEIDAVNEDADKRAKAANDAIMEFIGTADKAGPGRVVYARAVISKMFPEFVFSPDFKNDAVVTEVLDAMENGLINNKTDLEEWLSSPTPSKEAESTPQATTTTSPAANEKQTEVETPVQTPQVSGASEEGTGTGARVPGGESRTSAILVEDPETKKVYTQTRDDYLYEADQISKLISDPNKKVTKKDATALLNGIVNAEQEINNANELSDEQKKEWFSPFVALRSQLEAIVNNKTAEEVQAEEATPAQQPAAEPGVSKLDQAVTAETPVKLEGQRGTLVRDDLGRPVFKPFDGSPEIELKITESAQNKDTKDLEPSDYGTDSGTVEIADNPNKQYSVLPDNSPRPLRPFFRSEPSQPRPEGKTAPEPKVDTAKIVADVQANPQANTRKVKGQKQVSREAAVAIMVQLPETVTRREAISIGKDSGMSKPADKVLRLAQLRNDPNAVRDILAGKYDSELGLFDRGSEAPIQTSENGTQTQTQNEAEPQGQNENIQTSSTTEEEPEVRSNKKAPPPAVSPDQTAADRWVSDSLSALQDAASNSPEGAAFLQKISTPEGKAEAQRMLAGMYFDSLLKNIKAKGISDPIVIEDAMDKILRGSVTQGGEGSLTKSVLGDLLNNLKETGDPFMVKTKKGETAAYSAWLARGRNQIQPLYRQQNSREQAIPGKEGQEGGTNVENTTAAAVPSTTEDTLSESQQEVRRMTTMAVQSSYYRVVDQVAKQLGLSQKEVGLVVLHLLEKNAGFEVDPVSLGWKAEGETTRIKQTVKKAVEPMFPDILRSLQSEMREAISRVQATAEENGLLVAPVTRPTLESIIESSLYAERLQQKFQEPLKQARENKSPEPLIPLLNQIYSDPFIRSLVNQAVATYVNNGAMLQNVHAHHRLIGALTAEDTQRILDSGLLPQNVREVLQTLSDLSGSNGLDLVKTSSNEGYRRLADLLEEQVGKLSNPVQVVFNLALDPEVTGGGLWAGGSKVHVSPFLTAPGQMEATILHEVMHPVWDWKITTFLQNPDSPLLSDNEKATLTEIKELHDRIREEAQRRVDEAKAAGQDTTALERDLRGALGDGDPVLALREFLNETLSHKAFQDFLNEMKADGNNGSVFRRVLNLILRAITGKDVALDSVLQRTFELSLEVAKGPAQEAPQTVTRENYLQGIEQQLGRSLSPEERDVHSADYAVKFPQSPLSGTRSEADDKASQTLSPAELDTYNHLRQTEDTPVLLSEAAPMSAMEIADAIKNSGGITVHVATSNQPAEGYAVAPFKGTETIIPLNEFGPEDVQRFMDKFRPVLEVPGMHLGGWVQDGSIYLDVSVVTPDEVTATTLAQDGNQLAIFNLGTFESLNTPDLLAKHGEATGRERTSDGYKNLTRALQQAYRRVMGGVQSQNSTDVQGQGALQEGSTDLAVADNPELGVVESLTGKKLTPDEIAQTQGPLQSAPTGQVDDGSGRLNFIYTSGGTNRSVPLRGAEGLRLLAEATSNDIGGGESTRQTNESLSRGFRALEAVVDKAGLNIAPPFFKRLANPNTEFAESGAEHSVYFDKTTNRVIKLTHADMVGDGSLGAKGGSSDYFTSLHLNNLVFANTGTRFEGLVDLGEALPQVVTSQPFVKGRKATTKEIQADLIKRGFTKRDARKDANIWEHKDFGVGIYDAVPSNVLRDPEGNLHYIDVDVFPLIPLSEVYSRIEKGQQILQSAPLLEKPSYKIESNMMSGDSARYFASTGMDRVSPMFKSEQEAKNWIDKKNAEPAQEGFNNSREVTDYIDNKFGKTLKALKTEAMANYAGYEAQYIVSSNRGNHFIEYNPVYMTKYTPAQVDAVMREEIIHAAAGLILTRKGMDWTTFYGDLGNSLSKEQVASLKKVYTSTRSKVDVGAEYFRASVQKLLYGTITEEEMKQTAMQKIIALFKDLLSYFQSKAVAPEVRGVYDDTLRIMQKADPKYAAKVLQSAPVVNEVPEGLQRLEGDSRLELTDKVWDSLSAAYAKIGGNTFKDKAELVEKGAYWDVARDSRGNPVSFFVSKPSEHGVKLAALASDGSLAGKALTAASIISFMQTPGHWGELSEGPERIAQKAGLPMIPVEAVQQLLGPDKPITPLEDGYHYTREITTTDGLNKTVTKAVYGIPLWKTQQNNQTQTSLTGKTTPFTDLVSSPTTLSEISLPKSLQGLNQSSTQQEQGRPSSSQPLEQQEKQESQNPKALFSAPVFQGAPVPGFQPSVFSPASRRQTEALLRVRFNPEYAAIQNALGNKTYYSWTEKDTLAKADEFIAAHNGDLQLAFQTSLTNPGLTNEQAIMVRGLSIKRAQAAANAAAEGMTDTSLSAQRRNDLAMAREYYQDLAESFADSVMNEASQVGSELRTFRMLADVLVPQTWVKRYKDPVIKAQRRKLGKEQTAQQLMQGLMDARRMAANSTFDRMRKALAMAGRKFLPTGTSSEEVEAYEKVARMLASGLPVREDVKKAAAERVVVSGLETIKKALGPKQNADPALLKQWEDRLRSIAGEQIDKIISERLKGGQVDQQTETLTDEQKIALQEQKIMDVWRSLSDVPLAETVFNLARATMETANNPYAGLVRNAVFDTNRVSQIEKAVRLSINTAEEIRKSVADKGMSIEALKLRLQETNPNLNDQELDKLSNAVEAVYNDEVSKATRAALDRLVKTAANPAKARQLSESNTVTKLLPLVNMGAFSEEAVYNAIADKFNLPTWSPETAKTIQQAAERVQALPEGSIQRGEAGQEMMLEILRANIADSKGGKKVHHLNQIASAIWTAGVLSGPPTQIINATTTTASVFLESLSEATGRFIEAKKRGVSTAQSAEFFKDIARMWLFSFGKDANNTSRRAINEVYSAMTKGTTKFKAEKMEDMAPLELYKFDPRVAVPGNAMMDALVNGQWKEAAKSGLKAGLGLAVSSLDKAVIQRSPKEAAKDYLAVLKVVGRAMLAADSLNSVGAAYIKEAMIKRSLLQMEGLSDQQVNERMTSIIKNGEKDLLEDAKAQVEDEAIRGDFGAPGTTAHEVAKARRLEQLIETATYGKSVVEAGRDFAAEATFNGDPYGLVGMVSMEVFARMNSALGLLAKPFNPFPKTLSNLFNAALNYTFWGNLRAQGWSPSSLLLDENSKYYKAAPDRGSAEYYGMHARAIAGSTALMTFAALLIQAFKDRKEGKEPFFEVHGSGPTDPKQRGQWNAAGNKAFSIRINGVNLRFTDWPGLSLALGALGTVYDQAVYGDGEAEFTDKLFTAVASVAGTTLNRNMLGGASALFDIMSKNTFEGAKQSAAASIASSYISGFTKPSFVRWLETNLSGGYQDTRGMQGWLLAQVPFGGVIAGKPSLNVLGEKVEVGHWDSTAGRLISTRDTHPVLSPLTTAGLYIQPPQQYKVLDRTKESGMRKMTPDEFYEYGKLYGENLKERLTPSRIQSLVERAKRDPQAAQDRLNEIATMARNKAQNELRHEREIKKAPHRIAQNMKAQPVP